MLLQLDIPTEKPFDNQLFEPKLKYLQSLFPPILILLLLLFLLLLDHRRIQHTADRHPVLLAKNLAHNAIGNRISFLLQLLLRLYDREINVLTSRPL